MHSQRISWHLHPATSHLIAHQKANPPSVALLHNCWQDNADSCWELTGLSGWLNTTCCWSAIPQIWPVKVKASLTWDSAQFLFGLLAIYHLDKNILLLVPLLNHSLRKTAANTRNVVCCSTLLKASKLWCCCVTFAGTRGRHQTHSLPKWTKCWFWPGASADSKLA